MRNLPLRPSAALLSRAALRNNLEVIQRRIKKNQQLHSPQAKIMAIVKADAYGHGLSLILPELQRQGIRFFAVATLDEALEARRLSRTAEILVLGGTFQWGQKGIELLKTHRLHVAANTIPDFLKLSRAGLPVHLKLDTGMNRLGVSHLEWDQVFEAARSITKKKGGGAAVAGVFTHFATAQDQIFLRQVSLFEEALRYWVNQFGKPAFVHCENSGGLFGNYKIQKGILSEVGTHVRPGLSLYGYTPRGLEAIRELTPVLELVTKVSVVKRVQTGEGISYGHLYKAKRAHDYAVLPIGYADGVSKHYREFLEPRLISPSGKNKGDLLICGAICMDMVMVRGKTPRVKLKSGDYVKLWGRFPNAVLKDKIVEAYELNLRISKRIPRFWDSK